MLKNTHNRILTIDLEDWFHSFLQDPYSWGNFERRAHMATYRLLELLKEYGSQATFFVLGDVAEHHRELIKDIANDGHEIGSHGFRHEYISNLTPDSFRQDIRQSIQLLESITGKPVQSYRAPHFSISKETMWSLEILKEEGIKYDSSIFPIKNGRYGMPNAKRIPHQILPDLWEWPITTLPSQIGNIPFAGGFYFRFFPWRFFSYAISAIEKMNEPVLVYLHPWEIDIDQPYYRSPSRFLNFRHYYGLKNTEEKIKRLLGARKFTTLATGFKNINGNISQ